MPIFLGMNIAVDALLFTPLDKVKIIEAWIKGGVTISYNADGVGWTVAFGYTHKLQW